MNMKSGGSKKKKKKSRPKLMRITGYKPKENNIYVKACTCLFQSNFKLNLDFIRRRVTLTKTSQLYIMCCLQAAYIQFSVAHMPICVRTIALTFLLNFTFCNMNCFTLFPGHQIL